MAPPVSVSIGVDHTWSVRDGHEGGLRVAMNHAKDGIAAVVMTIALDCSARGRLSRGLVEERVESLECRNRHGDEVSAK